LCPDIGRPKCGGLLDLMRALELAQPLADELPELNRALRRSRSLADAAAGSREPAAALAYLQAADKVIQVDDFAP
jgi:acyl-CoA dehydrogenase